MTVLVKKIGGSVAVVIPKAIANEMGLVDGTSLEITAESAAIVLRKRGRRLRRPLKAIVAEMNPKSYRQRRVETSTGPAVGKEIW